MEIITIRQYLRNNLTEWISFSVKICKGKCIISGEKMEVIHHKYPFHKIMDEVFEQLDIERKDLIENYDEKELEVIKNKCLELHFKYGAGACLTEEIHKEFHTLFGNNTTIEDFDKFIYYKQNSISMNDLEETFGKKIKKNTNQEPNDRSKQKEFLQKHNKKQAMNGKQGDFIKLIQEIKKGKHSEFVKDDTENRVLIIKKQFVCKLIDTNKKNIKERVWDKPLVVNFLNDNNIQILAQKLVIPY